MGERLAAERGVRVVPFTVWLFLDRHGITFKKTAHAAEKQRPDVLCRRSAWFDGQLDLDPEKLIFIDETWAKTNMTRLHGRCRCGDRLVAKVPYGRWRTLTFQAALAVTGSRHPA
ncbi:hypothetical protein [Mesorhizobium sp. WSM2561]|uniref:hypothetical protein n=1 Tax=Mesorhizobium sp. WSM2561 TaxID=1040985 RepID=UPI0012EC011D|nr:hypothetical protein [Mesorhizobium sp. WSM2561]